MVEGAYQFGLMLSTGLSVVVVSDREKHNTASAGVVASIDRKNPIESPVHRSRDTLTNIDSHSQVQDSTYTQGAGV